MRLLITFAPTTRLRAAAPPELGGFGPPGHRVKAGEPRKTQAPHRHDPTPDLLQPPHLPAVGCYSWRPGRPPPSPQWPLPPRLTVEMRWAQQSTMLPSQGPSAHQHSCPHPQTRLLVLLVSAQARLQRRAQPGRVMAGTAPAAAAARAGAGASEAAVAAALWCCGPSAAAAAPAAAAAAAAAAPPAERCAPEMPWQMQALQRGCRAPGCLWLEAVGPRTPPPVLLLQQQLLLLPLCPLLL